jgi:hypothetical protein
VDRITHPKPSQASDHYDREHVLWPLMCRAVQCIDEDAWAGTPRAEGAIVRETALRRRGHEGG